jgi:hypothetical protein
MDRCCRLLPSRACLAPRDSQFFQEDVVEEFNLALIEWLKQTDR